MREALTEFTSKAGEARDLLKDKSPRVRGSLDNVSKLAVVVGRRAATRAESTDGGQTPEGRSEDEE